MKSLLGLWRFITGLLGGRLMIAIWLVSLIVSYGVLGWALAYPMQLFDTYRSFLEMAAILASAASFGGVLALTYLWNVGERYSPWKLAPRTDRIAARVSRILILVSSLAAIPAVMLRAYSATSDRVWRLPGELLSGYSPSSSRTFSFADVPSHAFAAEALMFAGVVLLLLVAFRRTGATKTMAMGPVLFWAASQTTYRALWWLPFAAGLIIVVLEYVWRRWLSGRIENYFSHLDRSTRKKQRTPWLTLWRQQKAARSRGADDVEARLAALLALPSGAGVTALSVIFGALYLVTLPNNAAEHVPTTGALSFVAWAFAYLVGSVLARPAALPVMRLALLPVGHRRSQFGEVFLKVWWRDSYTKVLWAALLGFVLRAVCSALGWPAFLQSPVFAYGPTFSQWILVPLAHVVGLLGFAGSVCLIASASPRVLASANGLTVLPIATVILLTPFGLGCKWLLETNVAALSHGNLGFVTFALVNGAMLPGFAWSFTRIFRYQWRTASLPAISSGMQIWSDRLRKMSADVTGERS